MIIVRIYEGLGNQLFQYAYARAISLSKEQKVFLDIRETGSMDSERELTSRKYELENFRIRLPVCTNVRHFYPYLNSFKATGMMKKLSEYQWFPYKYFSEDDPLYDRNLLDLKGNWYLQGWFQDSRYFQKYADIIRKELTPRKKIKISFELKNILQLNNTVSVHIRRSDFKESRNELPVTYYYNAINYIREMIADPFWIVFSDDISWVKENINFGKNCYFVSGKEKLQDYEELIVMSCCRNHIIANSTYSWWGAWLGRNDDKIVVGPNKWFLRRKYSTKVIPKEWIQVPIR